ncbi:hypothetical protein BVI434_60015 [Burkholderia vietnamiensis]|nr:hypothetical protein BVI2075_370014 [Burkholderia vietnamiensis]CAG9229292.1 hypothetical protein BVI434_60015 [Burkholderia vietnamiensis]CAG9230159.1 hypothetical protein BVI1335_710013 [Burkholderia vietnamiensis]
MDHASPVVRIHRTALATTRGSARGRPRRFSRIGSSAISVERRNHSSSVSSSKNIVDLSTQPGRGCDCRRRVTHRVTRRPGCTLCLSECCACRRGTALQRCRHSRQWRTNHGLTPMWEFLCTKHTILRVYLNMTMT